MSDELRLRITVEGPPPGVTIRVQRGRDGLLLPLRSTAGAICFEFVVRLGAPLAPGQLRFLGEFAQGPAGSRFIYVNSGVRAGQTDTCWERRAKVPLSGITRAQVRQVQARAGLLLEARIAGTAGDGGPMCGSVPLLGDGWTVRTAA